MSLAPFYLVADVVTDAVVLLVGVAAGLRHHHGQEEPIVRADKGRGVGSPPTPSRPHAGWGLLQWSPRGDGTAPAWTPCLKEHGTRCHNSSSASHCQLVPLPIGLLQNLTDRCFKPP